MAHKAFGQTVVIDDPETVEPITFDLATEKDIACRQRVNGKLLIELVGKVESGSVGKQSEGILSIFDVCVLRDDGDNPEDYTGRPFNPDRPLANHTAEELKTAAEEGVTLGIDPTSSTGRLMSVLNDPNIEIEISELAELVGWLVEQYTGRPTKPAGRSGGGRTGTSRTSARGRRSRGGSGNVATLASAQTSSSESTSS